MDKRVKWAWRQATHNLEYGRMSLDSAVRALVAAGMDGREARIWLAGWLRGCLAAQRRGG